MDIKYAGTTVNERLYVSGLSKDFDVAVNRKDVKKIISILEAVELTEGNIRPILDQLGFVDFEFGSNEN